MSNVIELEAWRASRSSMATQRPAHLKADPLECPKCEALTQAISATADGTIAYRCLGHGGHHRPLAWRIDATGNMMRGLLGKRYY